jgi:hypothetical protein
MWPQCGTRNLFARAKVPIFLKKRGVAAAHRQPCFPPLPAVDSLGNRTLYNVVRLAAASARRCVYEAPHYLGDQAPGFHRGAKLRRLSSFGRVGPAWVPGCLTSE